MDVQKFHDLLNELRYNAIDIRAVSNSLSFIGLPIGGDLANYASEIDSRVNDLSTWLTATINEEFDRTHQHTANLLNSCLAMAEGTKKDSPVRTAGQTKGGNVKRSKHIGGRSK